MEECLVKTMDNFDKGMILEKAVSHALWNNGIEHKYNPWDDKGRYPCGDAEDHYLTDFKCSIECKNHAKKTVQNFSPAWIKEQVVSRGKIDFLVISYEPKSKIKECLISKGLKRIIPLGFQVNNENYSKAVDLLTCIFYFLLIAESSSTIDCLDANEPKKEQFSVLNNVDVCNSAFIISYFIGYLLVNCVFDSIVNVFYMIINDKPKINDPPDNKKNKIIDDCVSETNNDKSNIIHKRTNSNNKFYLTLNPNKITSKIKNHLNKTNHILSNCLTKIPNKINPHRLFSKKMPLLPFASFG
ncbi:MAG: hypothetical protein ACOWW1_07395 [archaeon]